MPEVTPEAAEEAATVAVTPETAEAVTPEAAEAVTPETTEEAAAEAAVVPEVTPEAAEEAAAVAVTSETAEEAPAAEATSVEEIRTVVATIVLVSLTMLRKTARITPKAVIPVIRILERNQEQRYRIWTLIRIQMRLRLCLRMSVIRRTDHQSNHGQLC